MCDLDQIFLVDLIIDLLAMNRDGTGKTGLDLVRSGVLDKVEKAVRVLW